MVCAVPCFDIYKYCMHGLTLLQPEGNLMNEFFQQAGLSTGSVIILFVFALVLVFQLFYRSRCNLSIEGTFSDRVNVCTKDLRINLNNVFGIPIFYVHCTFVKESNEAVVFHRTTKKIKIQNSFSILRFVFFGKFLVLFLATSINSQFNMLFQL